MTTILAPQLTHSDVISMLGNRVHYRRAQQPVKPTNPMTIYAPNFGVLCDVAKNWGIDEKSLRVEACGTGVRGTVL
ncbi:MAG: hypothetical protein MI864_28685 [Pseudomonadales bacterium]|nr:hypothetical protein [Pseudomonadales bacterium]